MLGFQELQKTDGMRGNSVRPKMLIVKDKTPVGSPNFICEWGFIQTPKKEEATAGFFICKWREEATAGNVLQRAILSFYRLFRWDMEAILVLHRMLRWDQGETLILFYILIRFYSSPHTSDPPFFVYEGAKGVGERVVFFPSAHAGRYSRWTQSTLFN